MAVAPRARRCTVEEYEHMVEAGVFGPDLPLAFPGVGLRVDDILGGR